MGDFKRAMEDMGSIWNLTHPWGLWDIQKGVKGSQSEWEEKTEERKTGESQGSLVIKPTGRGHDALDLTRKLRSKFQFQLEDTEHTVNLSLSPVERQKEAGENTIDRFSWPHDRTRVQRRGYPVIWRWNSTFSKIIPWAYTSRNMLPTQREGGGLEGMTAKSFCCWWSSIQCQEVVLRFNI